MIAEACVLALACLWGKLPSGTHRCFPAGSGAAHGAAVVMFSGPPGGGFGPLGGAFWLVFFFLSSSAAGLGVCLPFTIYMPFCALGPGLCLLFQ